METNEQFAPIVRAALEKNAILRKEDFSNEKAYENTLNAKIFDIIRYVLPCNVATSL
jgi:thymidylate synthase ThyX